MLLLLTLLAAALAYMVLPGSRGGVKAGMDMLAGLNASVRIEMESRFSQMDLSQKELLQELQSVKMQISSQDSLSALEKLRNELDILTANSSAASASQKSMESGWSFFESEVEQAGALSTSLHGALAPDDGWQNTMESLKEQISALASAVKDYSSVTNALQEKEMSSSGLSPEVLDTVKGIVRTAVLEHWVLDSQAKVKAGVISELQKNVMENTHATQQEVVERKVREAVTAAVNTNAPSKIESSVTESLKNIIKERLSGVDWLLAINGAQITQASASYDSCQGEDGLNWIKCNAQNSLATPVQLNPVTILKPDGITSVLGDDANGLRLGQCWAMGGSNGFVEIQLSRAVTPRAVVIEHAPASISIGGGDSAVKSFRVLGWNSGLKDAQQYELTTGEYKLTSGDDEWLTPHIQTFPVNSTSGREINRVRFEVLSNHGHQQYTCIYHIRLLAQQHAPTAVHTSASI